jgi:ribonuclease P protein component
MITNDNRLSKLRDFSLVLKHGTWKNGVFLSLKRLELAKNRLYFPPKVDVDKFEKQLRIAINVGLKVSKKAVVRNRIKRQIREVIRLLLKENKIKIGQYLFFDAKAAIKEKKYAEISAEIELLLHHSQALL